jgi:hypothetical protein
MYVNNSYSSCLTPITSSPFVIKFLNACIKVCAGCKGPHPKDTDGNVLPPPHDLCLQHEEAIHFVNPKTGKEASKNGNAYYHACKCPMCNKEAHTVSFNNGYLPRRSPFKAAGSTL